MKAGWTQSNIGRGTMQQGVYDQNGEQTKVLVIDDAENIVEFVKLGLKYEGFEVEGASNGLEGLAAAQRLDPALVILDLMLPGIDGLEVCRRLRRNPTTQDVPRLMLTTKDDIQDHITGLDTYYDQHYTQPFNL